MKLRRETTKGERLRLNEYLNKKELKKFLPKARRDRESEKKERKWRKRGRAHVSEGLPGGEVGGDEGAADALSRVAVLVFALLEGGDAIGVALAHELLAARDTEANTLALVLLELLLLQQRVRRSGRGGEENWAGEEKK